MTLETAARVVGVDRRTARRDPAGKLRAHAVRRRAAAEPAGGLLPRRAVVACHAVARGVRMLVNVITNGLLLTPEVVDRLAPYGLNGVKITLDGDHDTHNRMRPLRGGQGTFDKIIENVRRVAGKCRISIGGNFDESSVESYPALLDFLREQEFADKLARVSFKPVIREPQAAAAQGPDSAHAVGADGQAAERHVHDVGRRRHQHLRQLQFPRRQDVVSARGNEEARLQHRRRRAHGTVRDPPSARAHDRPGRRAVRVPGIHWRYRSSRPATSTDVRTSGRLPRPPGSRRSPRGRSATTAPSSRSAPAAVRSPRTWNSET